MFPETDPEKQSYGSFQPEMDYLKIYNTLDSTNLEMQRLVATGPVQHGLAILALEQTNGKGQMGRVWLAEPGSHLSMTIFFRPEKMASASLSTLGMKISLAVAEALKDLDVALHPQIKWPNDVYVHDKKICGILIENALSGLTVQHSIIGIGMNVNEQYFPAEIPKAVSIHQLTGSIYQIQEVASLVRQHVLSILESTGTQWKNRYDELIYGKDKQYSFTSGDQTFEAKVMGVSDEGLLQLDKEGSGHIQLASHQVKWLI